MGRRVVGEVRRQMAEKNWLDFARTSPRWLPFTPCRSAADELECYLSGVIAHSFPCSSVGRAAGC